MESVVGLGLGRDWLPPPREDAVPERRPSLAG
jgi:hypothetical protein